MRAAKQSTRQLLLSSSALRMCIYTCVMCKLPVLSCHTAFPCPPLRVPLDAGSAADALLCKCVYGRQCWHCCL